MFHKRVQHIFGDLSNVETDIDDFLIWAVEEETHHAQLIHVLDRARKHNMTLNINKCHFGVPEIVYLGHKLNVDGVFPDEGKIKAIKDMPRPESKKELQRFLGLTNYVGKFIPNLSERTKKLRELLKKDVEFIWEKEHQQELDNIKGHLMWDKCLFFYDVSKEVPVEVNACNTGLGTVLVQEGKTVAYVLQSYDCGTKEVCDDRKRATSGGIRLRMVPPIYLWEARAGRIGSQATGEHYVA